MNKMHVYRTIEVSEINQLIKKISKKVVNHCENQYNSDINNITKIITSGSSSYKILLLAGPSASGKTTTSNLIRESLLAEGIGAWCVSLDDFFKNPKDIKILSDGQPDYESLDSLDLPLIHKCLHELIENSESKFPVFDFLTNSRSNFSRNLKIDKHDIVIIEGLHALNPNLLLPSFKDQCLKVYVSVSTSYIQDEQTVLTPRDLRLIRRIIRDHNFRNTLVYETLGMWQKVCEGEKEFIDPFKESAQIFIDSCISYEPCIFHRYLKSIINSSDKNNEKYHELLKICDKLSFFYELDSSVVPANSILREFVG